MKKYRTVRIPDDLVKSILNIMDDRKDLGYRSHSEFIIDAVRRRVEDLIKSNQKSLAKIRKMI
ncbi:MAG: CopG family transcriptional regulator [Candidatus Lokiarchaeota archaeon]|nr:CopG family transcriptional regulator [Candidatus Lokiarchaeota archaeon]MBD3198614.1 CopG family transcriptional regulator [Candidatus Lokiarchaeota archaeon]